MRANLEAILGWFGGVLNILDTYKKHAPNTTILT